ncbi:MAG: Fur family transcriptional regulator [Bacteroidales bacterium]
MDNINSIKNLITDSGLKATAQRIAIYEALLNINDHPTAEMIKEYLSESYPTISLGTIYKTLDAFLKKNLIGRVQTEKDVTRYDVVRKKHYHLYCKKTNKIADYYDEELNEILNNYFQDKKIPDFKLEDIKLQIIGQFTNK